MHHVPPPPPTWKPRAIGRGNLRVSPSSSEFELWHFTQRLLRGEGRGERERGQRRHLKGGARSSTVVAMGGSQKS